MAASSRSTTAFTVLAVSMALLTVGLGVGGSMGIALNVVAIVGCVATIVLLARARPAEQGKDAERETG
jgi:hypothetical protein